VITLRFVDNLTQLQIAQQIGCSQMHVSRILRAALDRLRRALQHPVQSRVVNRDGRPAHTEPTIDSAPRRDSCLPTFIRPQRQLRRFPTAYRPERPPVHLSCQIPQWHPAGGGRGRAKGQPADGHHRPARASPHAPIRSGSTTGRRCGAAADRAGAQSGSRR
jgi:hypothetical protein